MAFKFGTSQIGKAPPPFWNRLSKALKFLLASLITTFSATDLYPALTVKKITLFLGIGIILVGFFDMLIGDADPQQPE